MSVRRAAVIDLGSNTFLLLIADILPNLSWQKVYKERHYVKLAYGGLGHIADEARDRAATVLRSYAATIREYGVSVVRAVGTSALREADNSIEVVRYLESTTGIRVEVIAGQEEARYILKGILTALPPMEEPILIMDPGGGSTEFILYHQGKMLFKESYKVGVAELAARFHRSDPMSIQEIADLEAHLEEVLIPVFNAVSAFPQYHLVGASGSFEMLSQALPRIAGNDCWAKMANENTVPILSDVIMADAATRAQKSYIPPERVDFASVGFSLLRYVIQRIPPTGLYYSDYAMKEGIMQEICEGSFG
jgi:exopolyphosphatase/guanosine-5'-triphosphate,3'-diphosphate pyrophosphatase